MMEHRSRVGMPDGEYLTMAQRCYVTRLAQGALFEFE